MQKFEIPKVSAEELAKIERSLAYTQATELITNDYKYGPPVVDGEHFFDFVKLWNYEIGDAPDMDDALIYLEARGLIEYHPEHSDWISIRDESEALDQPSVLVVAQAEPDAAGPADAELVPQLGQRAVAEVGAAATSELQHLFQVGEPQPAPERCLQVFLKEGDLPAVAEHEVHVDPSHTETVTLGPVEVRR